MDRFPHPGRCADMPLAVLRALVRRLSPLVCDPLDHLLVPSSSCGTISTRGKVGHHNLAASGAGGVPAASCKMAGWILRHVHHSGVHERWSNGEEDLEVT